MKHNNITWADMYFKEILNLRIYPSICHIEEGSICTISCIMLSLCLKVTNMLLSVHSRYNITTSPLLYPQNIQTLIQTLDALVLPL
jgi:hypothetical protein